jgi:hypothetical protein
MKDRKALNKDRAEAGRLAVAAMVKHVDGQTLADLNSGDSRAAIVDTLANIMHYARSQGFDPRQAIFTAQDHVWAEERGDD